MKSNIFRIINKFFKLFGLVLVPSQNLLLTYQHEYGTGGYEEYKKIQTHHNKIKIDQVWADEETIKTISAYIKKHINNVNSGICHGTRRGYEQLEFSKQLGCSVIGTEISDTAEQFDNTIEWDFHEQKDEWRSKFSFIYSNSLDQAFDPKKALSTWSEQLEQSGLLFIEHTMAHAASGASEMDPFGAHPMVMPYLFFKWGMGQYSLVDILELSHREKNNIWIFVIRKRNHLEDDEK